MAILSNGKFYGFLCSVKETGQRMTNGVKEYMDDFVSGFAGHGWKIWEYVKGKWRLEIDTIVVRETMLVFEMLISKIRAIIGAQAITQGHGKVKSVSLSEDGTEYLVELEEEDMSIVAHDFVRCQTFTGDKSKLYHVEVSSVDVETRTLHIPLSEFNQDEAGNVLNPPMVGDELVQFGNSQNKDRQSAIYMHADETGQPAIDVMFDIDSKNWEGKVKVRVGGDIPGANGLKGFYCENGMIKSVDNRGSVIYEFSPNGAVNIGKGNIKYNPTTNKVTLGSGVTLTWDNLSEETKENLKGEPGADGKDGNPGRDGIDGINGKDGNDGLSVVWKGDSVTPPINPQKNWVYRDTDDGRVYIYNGTSWVLMVADGNDGIDGTDGNDGMSVYITYHDSEEEPAIPIGDGTTEGWHTNATSSVIWMSQKVSNSASIGSWGNPIKIGGKDANLLPWVEKWNGYATELGEEYIVTPKLFSGIKNSDGTLTGIAQGRHCIEIDGETRTGIFAVINGEIVFKLDPEHQEYEFRGKIVSDSGTVGGFEIQEKLLYGIDENTAFKIGGRNNGTRFIYMNEYGTASPQSPLVYIRNDRGASLRLAGGGQMPVLGIEGNGSSFAIDSHGSHRFKCRSGERWNAPGVLAAGHHDGTNFRYWSEGAPLTLRKEGVGRWVVVHNLNTTNYYVMIQAQENSWDTWVSSSLRWKATNEFAFRVRYGSVSVDTAWDVIVVGSNYNL